MVGPSVCVQDPLVSLGAHREEASFGLDWMVSRVDDSWKGFRVWSPRECWSVYCLKALCGQA